MTTNNLAEKAMLVKLSIGQWTNIKHDRLVTAKANSEFNAEHDAGKYYKYKIAKEAFKEINSIVNKTRTFHYNNTLPWHDDGRRILPAANFMRYSQMMRFFHMETDDAVKGLIAKFSEHVEDAKKRLGDMFNAEDYPTERELIESFKFEVDIDPLPTASDFRVSLGDTEIANIQNKITERLQSAQETAMKDVWNRLYDSIKNIAEKLEDEDAIIRNSLIENLNALVGLLPRLNITNDTNLEKMCKEVEAQLGSYDAESLRRSPIERQVAGAAARSIADAIFTEMK